MSLVTISRELQKEVDGLRFRKPVAYVYNPLDYAWKPHEKYLKLYGRGPKKILWLGMNPGPFGMAQTGVPFGEVRLVHDFLQVSGTVGRPSVEHPKRLIEGFQCERSEVSGARLWGWVKDRFKNPEAFFKSSFVVNWCPLVFMEESGKNLTPDKLAAKERKELYDICDRALVQMIDELKVEWVIGVGAFAMKRAEEALEKAGGRPAVKVGTILHPSPASPVANRGWAKQAEAQLKKLGLIETLGIA